MFVQKTERRRFDRRRQYSHKTIFTEALRPPGCFTSVHFVDFLQKNRCFFKHVHLKRILQPGLLHDRNVFLSMGAVKQTAGRLDSGAGFLRLQAAYPDGRQRETE